MPQEIYNEGRVVGLSAWELFKRQALSNGVPEDSIPNEREWLASLIGAGASMVLKITGDNDGYAAGVHDYELPFESNLTGAGVILASPFMGDCEFEGSGSASWANKIKSYGPLIENDSTKSPSSSSVPSGGDPSDYKDNVSEFLKITDGIVFTRNAKWYSRREHRREDFSGDGTTTAFPLTTTEQVLEITEVIVNNIPTSAYTFASNTITLATAPGNEEPISVYYDVVNEAPAKDIDPNFNASSTVVRLYFNTELKHDVYLLLTGFTNKRILQGLSGWAREEDGYAIGGSTDADNNDWVNGGLLGPELVPWASKIIFTVPNSSYNFASALSRTIPSDETYTIPQGGLNFNGIKIHSNAVDGAVRSSSVIDFTSINLTDYYSLSGHSFASAIQEKVSNVSLGLNDSMSNLVAWYPGMTAEQINYELSQSPLSNANFFPPALYAAKVIPTGNPSGDDVMLVPLDTAAPGTVKGFSNPTDAANYANLMTENYALYYNPQNNTFSFVVNGLEQNEWPGAAKIEYGTAPKASITAGQTTAKFIALNSAAGVDYSTAGDSGNVIPVGPANNLVWDNLLSALKDNNAVDVLGARLHALGNELTTDSTIGVAQNNPVAEVASTKVTVTGDYPVSITTARNNVDSTTNLAALDANQAYKSGTEFIEFSNGLRLYISNQEPDPTNVPLGSIGIGWAGSSSDSVENEIISENPPLEEEHHVPAMGG